MHEKREGYEHLNEQTLYPYEEYKAEKYDQGHHWGMHVDMNSCIGCGACVAVCKNSSAALFLSAKVAHLVKLPQGKLERAERVVSMVNVHDEEGFGSCTNTGACAIVCPQEIPLVDIARMNYEYNRSKILLNEK